MGIITIVSYQNQESFAEKAMITLNPLPEIIKENDFITFSGTLVSESGKPIPKATIHIKEDDFGPDEIITKTRTNDNGYYSVKIEAWDWDSYTTSNSEIYARFIGDGKYDAVETKRYSIRVYDTVEKNPADLTLDKVSVNSALVGDTITFTGTLTSFGKPIVGVSINIKEDDPLHTDEFLASGITDSKGKFSIPWKINRAGFIEKEFDVYAEFKGTEYYYSDSGRQHVSISKVRTWITLDQIPSTAKIGEQVVFSGMLKLEQGNTEGIFVYIKDEDRLDHDDLLAAAWVNSKGRFFTSWVVTKVDIDNDAEIYAEFGGDNIYSRSTTCGTACFDTMKLSISKGEVQPPTIFSGDEYMELYYSLDFNSEPVVAIVPEPDSYDLAWKYIVTTKEGIRMWESALKQKFGGNWNVEFEVDDPYLNKRAKEPDIYTYLVSPETESNCIDNWSGLAKVRKTKPIHTYVCFSDKNGLKDLTSVSATAAHEFIHAVGLGHAFNKKFDLMCSKEGPNYDIETCPGGTNGKSKSPSDFNLASVVAIYGREGFQLPNNNPPWPTQFTYIDYENLLAGTYTPPKTNPFTATATTGNTGTPKPTVSEPIICEGATFDENGKCVLAENYFTSFNIDDIKKQLEDISQIISEQLRSIYEKILSQVSK